jgi:hypothetical protein
MERLKIYKIHESFRVVASCALVKPGTFMNAETEGLFEYVDMGSMDSQEEETILKSNVVVFSTFLISRAHEFF